jgi:hypothetical protein
MLTRTFSIEGGIVRDMLRFPGVDWNAVVAGAIRTKLKVMRQCGTDVARPLLAEPPAPVRRGRQPAQASVEEIRQRVAERRLAATETGGAPC